MIKKNLKLIIFSFCCFLGCRIPFYLNLDHRSYIKNPIIRSEASLSPDDKILFFILDDYKTINKVTTLRSKICSYNLATDSTSILLSSDSIAYRTVFCSNDGSKILYTSLSKEQGYCLSLYDIRTRCNALVFHHPHAGIAGAVLSKDNKYVYFESSLTIKPYALNPPYNNIGGSIFSININGTELTKISTFYNLLIPNIYIDKSGENLYFNLQSDSISGSYKLNLITNALSPLMPDNLHSQCQYMISAPSLSGYYDYLCSSNAIYKYNERTKKIEYYYRESKNEEELNHGIYYPTLFNNDGRLLILKDTLDGEQYFLLLNNSGKIERTFRPSIAKYSDTKKSNLR